MLERGGGGGVRDLSEVEGFGGIFRVRDELPSKQRRRRSFLMQKINKYRSSVSKIIEGI